MQRGNKHKIFKDYWHRSENAGNKWNWKTKPSFIISSVHTGINSWTTCSSLPVCPCFLSPRCLGELRRWQGMTSLCSRTRTMRKEQCCRNNTNSHLKNTHFPLCFEIYTGLKPRNANMQSSTCDKSKTDVFWPVRIETEDTKGSSRAF